MSNYGINRVYLDGYIISSRFVNKRKKKFVVFVVQYDKKNYISCYKFGNYSSIINYYYNYRRGDFVRIEGVIKMSRLNTVLIIRNLIMLKQEVKNAKKDLC